ncbi:hypothetical protein [Massilia sp. CF038]|uniref:hypothetical protein n=1 Tax=Massilia sp. CF038 TaxID=1881045 RepID=UPI0009222C0F|nr:hypothetical protein [Massilia sp. CF038]SHG95548.1 hypothetical protein SAMN05428948_2049 [Massilia sp. CF038]
MKFVLALLFALAMAANSYAAAQARPCCGTQDCTAMQCVDMGCLPPANALAPPEVQMPLFAGCEANGHGRMEGSTHLPSQYKEVWTPPD